MGHYEDFFWEVTQSINEKGLRGKFDSQLKKMSYQDKHKHKDIKERWSYALEKITSGENKKNA